MRDRNERLADEYINNLCATIDKKDALINILEEYIEFLGDHISKNAVYLDVHRIGASKEDIIKGEKYRVEIAKRKE